jgi:hypothetical protein
VPAHFAWASSAGGLDPLTLRISHLVVNALTDPEGDSIRFADEGPGDEWLEVASLCSTPLRLQGVAARGYWSRTHGRCLTTADFDRGAGPVRRLLEPAPPAAAGAPLAATARTGGGNQARDSGAATPATALPPVRIAIAHLPPRPEVRPGEDSPYLAGLSATAVLVPPVAIAVTALALIAAVSPAGIQSRFAGPVIGGVVALAAWLAGGLWSARLAISRLANSDEYGQVRLRLEELRPRLNCLIDSGASSIPPAAAESLLAARDLAAMLDEDLSIPGIRWVVAHGFIGAWMTIHRAEEALFIADDVGRIISEGLVDELRLEDSGMDHSDELLNWVRRALRALSPASADRYLHVPDGNAANSADEGIGVDRQDVARNVLRTARRVINEYRDEIWSGLIRARNQLQRTVLFSGILAYALVVLMPFAGLDSAALAAASVFFIFGALVGMIARLRLESGANKAVEDFGLETTRLMAAPLLSGLAAIFGVLLLGLAHVQLAGLSLGPAPPSGQAVPTLNQIFSLAGNPAGFLGAAIFGLTPSLLLDYLQTETKALKEALRITEATGAPPAKTAVQPQGGMPGGTG